MRHTSETVYNKLKKLEFFSLIIRMDFKSSLIFGTRNSSFICCLPEHTSLVDDVYIIRRPHTGTIHPTLVRDVMCPVWGRSSGPWRSQSCPPWLAVCLPGGLERAPDQQRPGEQAPSAMTPGEVHFYSLTLALLSLPLTHTDSASKWKQTQCTPHRPTRLAWLTDLLVSRSPE